jgi:hypothetical protein
MTQKTTPANAAFNATPEDQRYTPVRTHSTDGSTQLSPEALRSFDFELCDRSTYFSWSPKAAFDAREAGEVGSNGEYETLYDYLTQPDGADIAADTLLEVSRRMLPKADVQMTVYRAADETCGADLRAILPGASVTESKAYAKEHADLYLSGQNQLMETDVFPDELVTRGSPHDFTYIPRSLQLGYARFAADVARARKTD